MDKTAALPGGRAPRIQWYSLFDLPREWGASKRLRGAEGSSYYRHSHMGVIREDGTPNPPTIASTWPRPRWACASSSTSKIPGWTRGWSISYQDSLIRTHAPTTAVR